MGISSEVLSFFRFDENEKLVSKSFWDVLPKFNVNNLIDSLGNNGGISTTFIKVTILDTRLFESGRLLDHLRYVFYISMYDLCLY